MDDESELRLKVAVDAEPPRFELPGPRAMRKA